MLHTFIYIQNLVTQDEDFLRNTFPMQREKSIFVTSYPVRGGGGWGGKHDLYSRTSVFTIIAMFVFAL